jgi:phosphatidylinositol alpha-1,6-mannosyltransferase
VSRVRIALVPSAYYPSVGGVEELTRQLALAYVAKGHEAIVVTNRWPRTLPAREERDRLDVYRLPFRVPHHSLRGRVSYPLTNRWITARFESILRRHRIEVLHLQCMSTNCLYALRAKRKLDVSLVATAQGEITMDTAQTFQRDPFMADLLRRTVREADAVTACSARTMEDLERFVGHAVADGRVVHNGADVERFAHAAPLDLGYPYVLAIGRLVPQKGFDTLLRAWSALTPRGVRLAIAGDGPERRVLGELATRAGIAASVVFCGPVDRPEVPALFRGARAVVVPSRADEGLPLVAIEAMAAGRPLVVTRSGGVTEAVTDGVQGLVVDRDDVQQLGAAIARVLDDDRLAESLGQAARARARDFDWSVLADRYLDLFDLVSRARST